MTNVPKLRKGGVVSASSEVGLEDNVKGLGPCAACGHDPACGFASVSIGGGPEQWLCHTDDHSCYVGPE